MAFILTLPSDILEQIAEMSTWGCVPASRSTLGSYARNHASLARTCRGMYQILNEGLYKRNLERDPHIASCVLWAASHGRLDTMKRAVEYGADLSSNGLGDERDADFDWTKNQGHYTPLFAAIFSDHREIFDYLIDQDVDFNVPTQGCCDYEDQRCYPLHLGFQKRNVSLQLQSKPYARALIKKGARLFAKGTPFKPYDLVICRFTQGMVFKALKHSKKIERVKAFDCAVGAERYDLAKAILLKYPEIDLSVPVPESLPWGGHGLTILHHFAMFKRKDHTLFKLLLDRPELNANMELEDGTTLLLLATELGTIETARILIQRPEFEYKANNLGVTPLHRAVARGREMVELILQCPGVDINAVTHRGETALHYATEHQREKEEPKAEEERAEVVQMLLDHPDIDPLAVNEEGESALQYACGHKRADLALTLLKDPRVKAAPAEGSKDQCTLLFTIAIEEGSVEVMRELLTMRPEIDIDARDEAGCTALHAACSRYGVMGNNSPNGLHTPPLLKEDHMMSLVQCLVNAGASTDLVDKWGNTPLQRALIYGLFRIASWLLSKNSSPFLASNMLEAAFVRYRSRGSFGLYIELVKDLAMHRIAVDVTDLPSPELTWLSRDIESLRYFLHGVPELGLPEQSLQSGDVLSLGYYLDDFKAIDGRLKPEWVAYLLDAGARLDIPIKYPDGESESMMSAYMRTLAIANQPFDMDPVRLHLVFAPLIQAGAWCGPEGTLPSALEVACQTDIGGEKLLLEVMANVMTKKNVSREHVIALISHYEENEENDENSEDVIEHLRDLEKREFGRAEEEAV